MPVSEFGPEIEQAYDKLFDVSYEATAQSNMMVDWEATRQPTIEMVPIHAALRMNKKTVQALDDAAHALHDAYSDKLRELEQELKELRGKK